MTREEALYMLNDGLYDNEEVINKIYDDFESRTCENCKYYEFISSVDSYFCTNKESSAKFVSSDFGCNRFERIEV